MLWMNSLQPAYCTLQQKGWNVSQRVLGEKNSILPPLLTTSVVLRSFTVSPCPRGFAPSGESVGIPVCTFSTGSVCDSPVTVARRAEVHFRLRALIRLVRRRIGSHLSCQIQLCALLASKRREIFHFSSLQRGVSSSFHHPSPHVYPILSSILLLPPSFLFPVGVVEGHSAHWL